MIISRFINKFTIFIMFHSLRRVFYTRSSYSAIGTSVYSQNIQRQKSNSQTEYIKSLEDSNASNQDRQKSDSQIEYIKSLEDSNASNQDWEAVKANILSMRGNLNQKNIDAVMLKIMAASKNYVAASLFTQHLKTVHKELPLGSLNSVLFMYTALGTEDKLTKEQKKFILDTYNSLYDKYKALDSATGERLLHVLCVINEWEKALKVLSDIHLSCVPTHSAYSNLIATFFRLNKKKKALEIIKESIKYRRPLQDVAYEEWIKYILKKYKEKKFIAKHMDEIFNHIATNCAVISEITAKRMKDLYSSLNWDAQFARIRKSDGECSSCKVTLDCLSLSDEEFKALEQNVKDKLIVGSDLLLKTTENELKRFLEFVESTAPYDIVLDGLNICYANGMSPHVDKLHLLNHVVNHFRKQDKKIVLISRQHMLKWNKKYMEKIASKTRCFFTENLSQDDPFFITAAILSGPHTDIVSKDLLRGHHFNLKDDSLKQIFKRWQWQHQWMVFQNNQKVHNIQAPLKFTPCAQKKNNTWHLPYESETASSFTMINDGTPDLRHWLCLRQK